MYMSSAQYGCFLYFVDVMFYKYIAQRVSA